MFSDREQIPPVKEKSLLFTSHTKSFGLLLFLKEYSVSSMSFLYLLFSKLSNSKKNLEIFFIILEKRNFKFVCNAKRIVLTLVKYVETFRTWETRTRKDPEKKSRTRHVSRAKPERKCVKPFPIKFVTQHNRRSMQNRVFFENSSNTEAARKVNVLMDRKALLKFFQLLSQHLRV